MTTYHSNELCLPILSIMVSGRSMAYNSSLDGPDLPSAAPGLCLGDGRDFKVGRTSSLWNSPQTENSYNMNDYIYPPGWKDPAGLLLLAPVIHLSERGCSDFSFSEVFQE
jgi:hypothetical protein